MTREEAIGNLTYAIRWNDMPEKEALEMAIKALEQQPCEDCISRQEAIDALRMCYDTETINMDNGDEYINYGDAVGEIEQLPPVTPQQKVGYWISHYDESTKEGWYECDRCHAERAFNTDYCPDCGAKMQEVEE